MDPEQLLSRYRFPLGTAVAVYFQERGGHLYLKPLGSGYHGQVTLVRPVDDGMNVKNPTLFARKRGVGDVPLRIARSNEEYPVPEYIYPGATHPSIPEVLPPVFFGRAPYPPGNHGHAILQKFCNGGNLHGLLLKYVKAKKAVPEVFIWTLLRQLTKTLVWLHKENITHGDVDTRNVFLHYQTPTSPFPDIFLGDFGNARDADIPGKRNDIRDMVSSIKFLVTCHVGQFTLDSNPYSELTWRPYSGTLKRTVAMLGESMYDRFNDLLSDAVHETVESQFSFWEQSRHRADVSSQGNVSWTRPHHSTTPLFFNEKQLASVVQGCHPKSAELYGGHGNGKHQLIAQPWEFALVDKTTLSVIKVLTDEEVSEYVEVWGSVDLSDPDEIELNYKLGAKSDSSSREKEEEEEEEEEENASRSNRPFIWTNFV